jgi:nonsense-mediated mRNA decay protein 3
MLFFRFDLKNSNVNDPHLEKLSADKTPDVVLVKKVYGEKSVRNRRRKWRLKHMEGLHHNDGSGGSMSDGGNEYNDFLEDLEEDPELRKNVNVYKDASKISGQMAVDQDSISDSEDIPQITLAEMLDDLVIGSEHSANSQSQSNRTIDGATQDATGLPETPMVE